MLCYQNFKHSLLFQHHFNIILFAMLIVGLQKYLPFSFLFFYSLETIGLMKHKTETNKCKVLSLNYF